MDSFALETDAPTRSVQPYRERLLAGMAELCAEAPRARDPKVRDRLGGVFLGVLANADVETRRRFAERVAAAEWLAPALALGLAQDEIEVAQPVLAASPVLAADALRLVLKTCGAEHRAAVARRPRIDPALADAVVDTGEPLALAALAGNGQADLSAPVLRRLVEESRRNVALRAPLVRRADLYPQLARRMSEWVGEGLRDELARRFDFDSSPPPPDNPAEEVETEDRLVRKLEAAGQLKPGFLLRTLREDKLSLFEAALAALGGFQRAEVARALRCDRPDLLALACASVGVDRSVFPTILDLVRGLNAGAPRGGGGEALEGALLVVDRAQAAQAFRVGLEGL